MSSELDSWFVHTVTVTPLTGSGPYGDVFGAPQTVAGFLDDSTRLVRNGAGEEVVSQSTLFTGIDQAAAFLPGSLVDLGHRQATVIGQARRDAGGLDLPSHLEVQLT